MVANPATTVMRIAPANLSVKPVPTSLVDTNPSNVIPLLVMDSVLLSQAITQLASAASLVVSLDPELSSPAFVAQGTVSFRWERITGRQALAALLDNYDLVMIEDPATSAARIIQKFTAVDRAAGTSFYAMPKKGTPNQQDAGDAKYEIVLNGEKVVFDKAENVSISITIRNLGMKKLIAPDLYWGLSVIWDGKEYKRANKFSWNGPGEIIPKGYFSTGFSLSDYLVPAEVLTTGRHTIALKDAIAESNTLTVFIEKTNAAHAVREAAWGEPVEGVSVRLRAEKTRWTTNETPTFKLDVRNRGQREFYPAQSQETGRLEVDGVWYGWTGEFDLKSSWLPAGSEYQDIPVSLGSDWKATPEWRDKTQAATPQIPLKLLPGKHTIRFAPEIRDMTVKPKPQNNHVPSNPVEIETWSNLKELAGQRRTESTPTISFGIYLTAEPVDARITAYGKGDWSHIRLAESPVISATDIISYDVTNHSMRLRPEALARIPRPPVEGTPFVVVANGERIYLGAFTTIESSMTFAVPCIEVDARIFVTNQPADTLVIYPGTARGAGPDPRGDRRIRTALSALHKRK